MATIDDIPKLDALLGPTIEALNASKHVCCTVSMHIFIAAS